MQNLDGDLEGSYQIPQSCPTPLPLPSRVKRTYRAAKSTEKWGRSPKATQGVNGIGLLLSFHEHEERRI